VTPINDNQYRRNTPKIGECGLRTEDTGIDMWLSRQHDQGVPNELLRIISLQTWERIQVLEFGHVCQIKKTNFLRDIGLNTEKVVSLLNRYGWVFLSHHGAR